MLKHSTFKGIAFIIAMGSRKFNKYSYLHLKKGSLISRACCISDITWQQKKSSSSDIRRFITEITKSKKMHKFRKSLNISLVKTSTLSFNYLFQIVQPIYCQSKINQGSHFLLFHLFRFLTFTFLKVFSSFFQSIFRGLISDIGGRSCC